YPAFVNSALQACAQFGELSSPVVMKAEAAGLRYRTDGSRVAQWTHMWRLGTPIIAAVNGWAMGVGFWYQLAADITIASTRAVFAQPEVQHISNSSFLFTALCGWAPSPRERSRLLANVK